MNEKEIIRFLSEEVEQRRRLIAELNEELKRLIEEKNRTPGIITSELVEDRGKIKVEYSLNSRGMSSAVTKILSDFEKAKRTSRRE